MIASEHDDGNLGEPRSALDCAFSPVLLEQRTQTPAKPRQAVGHTEEGPAGQEH